MNFSRGSVRPARKAMPGKQHGAALILGLLLLVVMMMLGLSASNSTILQEKIAGNFRDASIAFQAGEAGGRWGSAWLQSLGASTGAPRPFPCTSSCDASAANAVWAIGQYNPASFDWTANGWAYGQSPTDASALSGYDTTTVKNSLLVAAPPKFIIEEQFFARDDLASSEERGVVYYRVISHGTGQRPRTSRVIATILGKSEQLTF